MRSCRISKRVIASLGRYNNGGVMLPPPVIVPTYYLHCLYIPPLGEIGPCPVTATRTPASVLELLQRLSYTDPWMPWKDRGNTIYSYGYPPVPESRNLNSGL
ncbi:hypothetical protein AVEN_242994-1 [Araneus ventricosus]|uniref:Uncharacterized protein n=1 Tax=Araneus ventricosus TaxID=182803 RepID=A0A4Y2D562_ARAVE|nr:hypothetical protein AVEN_242994-1 [Araneus ventricosus]